MPLPRHSRRPGHASLSSRAAAMGLQGGSKLRDQARAAASGS
ncbi:hypothetical protein [Microbacterium psychrotolerans]|nr:hypothetical protein [Microbacterium sp. QXD-8]